jgi:adenylosuccinate synthase
MKNGQGLVVIGGQWGDEGKGRIVDSLARDFQVIVRFQGGNNAGHSLHIGEQSIVLHLIPCGIMRADKVCIIGNGVVIDPEVLFEEIAALKKLGILCTPKNLKIAKNAHIIFPFHKFIDAKREESNKIGTTKRGIGPCYEDKIARFGIVAHDLICAEVLREKISNILEQRGLSKDLFLDLFNKAQVWGDILRPFLCDSGEYLEDRLKAGDKVLFEGAQGSLLDVDHGTYPYVTSSNCVAAAASLGSGVGMKWLDDVWLVSKAYCTRVGEGPFFTESRAEEQEYFRKVGNEFGATTGRARRCGWLDLPALKYAARINGATGVVLTKVDILNFLPSPKIALGYRYKNSPISFLDACYLKKEIEIDYLDLPKMEPMPKGAKKISDLPKAVQKICDLIEKEADTPVKMISFGPSRGQELMLSV